MKILNFDGYGREYFNDINLKIIQELLKLKEGEDVEVKFGDGSIILKKLNTDKSKIKLKKLKGTYDV